MNNLKTRIVLNWRLSAIFMGTKDKSKSFLFGAVVIFNLYFKDDFVYD